MIIFDEIMELYLIFLEESKVDAVVLAQTRDFIRVGVGKMEDYIKKKYLRKIMNWMFFKTDSEVCFRGGGNNQ